MGGVRCPLQWGASQRASDTAYDTPMLFFDNLVKKLDKLSL